MLQRYVANATVTIRVFCPDPYFYQSSPSTDTFLDLTQSFIFCMFSGTDTLLSNDTNFLSMWRLITIHCPTPSPNPRPSECGIIGIFPRYFWLKYCLLFTLFPSEPYNQLISTILIRLQDYLRKA
jgi:hypothetical protein